MSANDNYPMGVNGSHRYFNQPDQPECPECGCEIDTEFRYCPFCGEVIDWEEILHEEWWRCS